MSTPKWTVLYNGKFFRQFAFFMVQSHAQVFYAKKESEGCAPNIRRFAESDRVHLGA